MVALPSKDDEGGGMKNKGKNFFCPKWQSLLTVNRYSHMTRETVEEVGDWLVEAFDGLAHSRKVDRTLLAILGISFLYLLGHWSVAAWSKF